MTKLIVTILVLSHVFLACHRYSLKPGREDDRELLSEKTEGRKVELRLRSGKRFWARQLVVTADSTYWIDARSQIERTAATADVSRVILRSHRFKVGLAGAITGGLIALTAAGLVAAGLEEDEFGEVYAGGLVTALYMIPVGMIAGFAIGVSHGVKDDLHFTE